MKTQFLIKTAHNSSQDICCQLRSVLRSNFQQEKWVFCDSPKKQPTFSDATTGFPAKWRLRNEPRNSVLMTSHYPDLGSASDWLTQISRAAQPIRRTTQIWVVTRHQYGISALVSQTSFRGETSGSVAKWRLFSQVMFVSPPKSCDSWRVVGLSWLPRSSRLKYLPFLQSVFPVASCWPQFVASYWMLVLSPAPVVNLSTAVEQHWCCFLVSYAMTFHHRRSANKTENETMSNVER